MEAVSGWRLSHHRGRRKRKSGWTRFEMEARQAQPPEGFSVASLPRTQTRRWRFALVGSALGNDTSQGAGWQSQEAEGDRFHPHRGSSSQEHESHSWSRCSAVPPTGPSLMTSRC